MELWIRSQDKRTLTKINDIRLNDFNLDEIIANYKTTPLGSNEYEKLGTYKSKERALEVLNEIQNMIKPTLITTEFHSEIKQDIDKLSFDVIMQPVEDKTTYIQPNTIVYEMPQE